MLIVEVEANLALNVILSYSASFIRILHMLRSHWLQELARETTLAAFLYASPAWCGFMSIRDIERLERLEGRLRRGGCPTFAQPGPCTASFPPEGKVHRVQPAPSSSQLRCCRGRTPGPFWLVSCRSTLKYTFFDFSCSNFLFTFLLIMFLLCFIISIIVLCQQGP